MLKKEDLQKERDELKKKVDILELKDKLDSFEKSIMESIEKMLKKSRHNLKSYIHVEINQQIIKHVESVIKEKYGKLDKDQLKKKSARFDFNITDKQLKILMAVGIFLFFIFFNGLDEKLIASDLLELLKEIVK